MSSSRIDVFIHFNWQTKNRKKILKGRLERFVHQYIRTKADEFGLHMKAVNSAWDHSHVLVGWNSECSIREVTQQFKGGSSYRWNNVIREPNERKLEWQSGYGAFSIRTREVEDVRRYVDHQKEHHTEEELWWRFERHLWTEEDEREDDPPPWEA